MSSEEAPLISSPNNFTNRPRSPGASRHTSTSAVELSPSTSQRNNNNNNSETIESGNNNNNNNNNNQQSCEDCVIEALMYGPYKPSINNTTTKKDKTWLDNWNITKNTKEIFFRDRDTNLNCMDGARALAYLWVLDDHLREEMDNLDGFEHFTSSFRFTYPYFANLVEKGPDGVTSFFVLSGFLIPFIFTRLLKGHKQAYATPWNMLEFIFRRYMRLAPSIAMATIIVTTVGYCYGPSSYLYSLFYTTCKQWWWENILFLNNFKGIMGIGSCYDSVWTISVEMQLYFVSLIPLYFYAWDRVYGYIAIGIFTLTWYVTRTILSYYTSYSSDNQFYADYIYESFWSRGADYGIGMILFCVYDYYHSSSKENNEAKRTKNIYLSAFFWIALVGFMGYAMFFLVESKIGSGMASYDLAQYSTFGFTVYSAFMACGLYLCIDGTFWPIKWILDWYIWYPIASLAYTAGLLNILTCSIIVELFSQAFDDTWTGTLADYYLIYFVNVFFSLIFGYFLSILIERPFMNIAKAVKF